MSCAISGRAFLLSVFLLLPFTRANANDFAAFRGGQGVVAEQDIPTTWSANENLAWKIAVPGAGWSQPLIVGNRVYVTSAVSADGAKPKNFADGVKTPQSMGMGFFARAPKIDIEWKVFCYSTVDGRLLWEKTVHSGKPKFAIHPSNTYATESPVADESGVYVYFGAAGIVAGLDASGEVRWQRDVGVFKTSSNFGTGSSMAIHEGHVFVQNFSEGSADIYCFDTDTGKTVWKDSRERNGTSWTSPFVWKNAARVELIIASDGQIDGYQPKSGDKLWTLTNIKAASTATPCGDDQKLYFGASDPFAKGALFALTAGSEGDLSPKKKNTEFKNCAWMQKRAAPGMSSPVVAAGYVFVTDKNILRCYDSTNGERLYQSRIPDLDMVAASPIVVGEKLLVLDENGAASLIKVGNEFKVVGGGKLKDVFWSTPAVANGSIYLRGVDFLYCIRN